ncbi:unnamed protein product [Brachionus calyciflorus]|uniref:CSD domain-containing protein n=1 Tax=Brachionus calyciflorus TaxID=104777 RepID=A0A814D0N4_9BILA|nr:unnamed protein product [Brachionus calyciflorus]
MDDLIIVLPCGFTSLYKYIFNNKSKFPCPVCQTHDITSQECFNMTKNNMAIKEKDFDLKKENFIKCLEKLQVYENDPKNIFNNSYENLQNQIDLRREEIKLILNEKIDNYYENLLEKIKLEKAAQLNEFEINDQKLRSLEQSLKALKFENNLVVQEKSSIIDNYANKIDNGMKLIQNTQDNLRANSWIFTKGTDNYQIEDIFGKLDLKKEAKSGKICDSDVKSQSEVTCKLIIDNFLMVSPKSKSVSFENKNLRWTIKAEFYKNSKNKFSLGIHLQCDSLLIFDYVKVSGLIKLLNAQNDKNNFICECEKFFSKENCIWYNKNFISLNDIYEKGFHNLATDSITIEVCLNIDIPKFFSNPSANKKVNGKVKWYDAKISYGFIICDDNNEEIFVHQHGLLKANKNERIKGLSKGEKVEFDIVESEKGREAANVRSKK